MQAHEAVEGEVEREGAYVLSAYGGTSTSVPMRRNNARCSGFLSALFSKNFAKSMWLS